LALQYDNSADRDDITCQNAARVIVDKLQIKNVSVIHGTVGKQLTQWGSPYNVGLEGINCP
jgi:hypothetical protein